MSVCTFFYVVLAGCITFLIAGLRQNHGIILSEDGTCTDMCAAISSNNAVADAYAVADANTQGMQVSAPGHGLDL